MPDTKSNIVLIGMPGAGKSTVGIILAKQTARDFVDTDVLIQISECRSLQAIVDTDGYRVLRCIEEDVLLNLDVRRHVIATGGSAVSVEEKELLPAARDALKTTGIDLAPEGAAALAAIPRLLRDGVLLLKHRVVLLNTAASVMYK